MSTHTKIYSILNSSNRLRFIIILFLMVIGMLLEMIGVSLIVPIMGILAKNEINNIPVLDSVIAFIGNPDRTVLVVYVFSLFVGVIFVKNIFLVFSTWLEAKFSLGLLEQLSYSLYKTYLVKPYEFHLQRNSAQLIQYITSEITAFVVYGINPLMLIIAESLIMLGISLILVSYEPVGSLVVGGILTITISSVHFFTRNRLTRVGKARLYHDALRIKHIQQGLGGVKDIRLLGREAEFLSQYSIHNNKSAKAAMLQSVYMKIPKLWLETVAMGCLSSLVISMAFRGYEISNILTTLALFGAAAFRLMPSANRIVTSLQSVRYGLATVDTIYNEIDRNIEIVKLDKHYEKNEIQRHLTISDIYYAYPETNSTVLKGISLKINKGETIGLVGTSGSGKSTLVDLILGLIKPKTGEILVDNTEIDLNLRGWQDQIGYVPQAIFLIDDTIKRNIAFGIPNKDIDENAVKAAIKSAQLGNFLESLPTGLDTIVGERGVRLSGGQRQRIGIARALYHNPEVLVLDEATSSLDITTEKEVMESIRELKGTKTIIIVAHRLSTVEHCDLIYCLKSGRVIDQGKPDKIIANMKSDDSLPQQAVK
jgi:ATP-binding cassette, subfamily B, bacterial PglK